MIKHEKYMHRCIELARKGAGNVAPNPMVGAVLVYEDNIIGEGWHQHYGEAHAEVNCINSVQEEYKQFISLSTLYVSLEPCAHIGKTPPCSDLIIKQQIKQVIIGCRDPFKEVNGKGIEQLKAAGIKVMVDVLRNECEDLNKRFFTFHQKQRPYIILKWAQTKNGKIAASLNPSKGGTLATDTRRLLISNEHTNRLVHQWRSEEASVLVGTNTALMDDPQLTNRYWKGNQPIRLVIDKELKLPASLKLFNKDAKTILFNSVKHDLNSQPQYFQINKHETSISQILSALYKLNIQSVLVEGGAKLLQSFIDAGLWDEARVIENKGLTVDGGLDAPVLSNYSFINEQSILTDTIRYFKNIQSTISNIQS
jgi:diaminohydroxyphosphoribosylaminopyrimidine deaminase / 5-amino-6-(5-phosphoribosylamino)uracil reductase